MNRFQGTNIDTLRANHPFFRDQPVPNAQGRWLRDSVGPPFTPPPRVYDEFSTAMQRRDPASVKPMGMASWGNQCYRNAIPTVLVNSDVFIACARWHLDNESQYSAMAAHRGSRIFRSLVEMATINESQQSPHAKQAQLDREVADFWRTAAFPEDPTYLLHKITWPPKGPWGALENVRYNTQEDAAEFLIWLLDTVDGQLMYHHNSKDMRVSRKSSAQQNFDWFSMLNTATRIDCPQCTWRVHQRGRVARERPLVLKVSDMAEQSQSLSLQDCISRAFRDPLDDLWCCDRCKNCNTKGHKLLTIQHAPNLFMITLDRSAINVTYNDDGTVSDYKKYKHPRAVVIPETLDVSPWLNHHQFGPGSRVSYRLAGVVSHKGETLNFGHYLSYVRGGQSRDKWFELNDDKVTQLESISVFDDSNATKSKEPHRFTPVVLLYERDNANEVSVPGYHTINVNDGGSADVRPKRRTGGYMVDIVVDPLMPAATAAAGPVGPAMPATPAIPEGSVLPAGPALPAESTMPTEAKMPAGPTLPTGTATCTANTLSAVPTRVSAPSSGFEHFSVAGSSADQERKSARSRYRLKSLPRKGQLKKVTASDQVKEVHLDLMDAWFEAEVERRERAKEQDILTQEAGGKGKKDDDVEEYVDKKLTTWDRKRKRTPWPSRWTSDSESDDDGAASTRKQPQRQVKKARGSGRK